MNTWYWVKVGSNSMCTLKRIKWSNSCFKLAPVELLEIIWDFFYRPPLPLIFGVEQRKIDYSRIWANDIQIYMSVLYQLSISSLMFTVSLFCSGVPVKSHAVSSGVWNQGLDRLPGIQENLVKLFTLVCIVIPRTLWEISISKRNRCALLGNRVKQYNPRVTIISVHFPKEKLH